MYWSDNSNTVCGASKVMGRRYWVTFSILSLLIIQVTSPLLSDFESAPKYSTAQVISSQFEGNDESIIDEDNSGGYAVCSDQSASNCSGNSWDSGTSIELSPNSNDAGYVEYSPHVRVSESCVNPTGHQFRMRYDTYTGWNSNTHQWRIWDENDDDWDSFYSFAARGTMGERSWNWHSNSAPSGAMGDYIIGVNSTHSMVKIRIDVVASSEMEIDYLQLRLQEEQIRPTNPSSPEYVSWDGSFGQWSNDSSIFRVDFGTSGYDACDYDSTEYWIDHSTTSSGLSCNSPPASSLQSTDSATELPQITFSSSGYWRLCWRAVDGFENTASWSYQNFLIDFHLIYAFQWKQVLPEDF